MDKILSKSMRLEDVANVSGAATVSEAYELKKIVQELSSQKDYFKFINTGTIDRYCSLWGVYDTTYIKGSYKKPVVNKGELKKFAEKRYVQALGEKIIVGGMTKELECYLDWGEYLAGKSTTIITFKKIDLKVLIAILNSKLMTFVYKSLFKSLSLSGGYIRVGSPQIKLLPIKTPSLSEQKAITELVDRMLALNTKLSGFGTKLTSETKELIDKITAVDKELNKHIYELYGVNETDIQLGDFTGS
jgi:hypothetical protein